jgi:hypothetical protein
MLLLRLPRFLGAAAAAAALLVLAAPVAEGDEVMGVTGRHAVAIKLALIRIAVGLKKPAAHACTKQVHLHTSIHALIPLCNW